MEPYIPTKAITCEIVMNANGLPRREGCSTSSAIEITMGNDKLGPGKTLHDAARHN